MKGLRAILGIAASVGLHAGSMVALSHPTPPKERQTKPAVIELTALPPAPEPESPEATPPQKPAPPKPKLERPAQPTPATKPPSETPPLDMPPTSVPLVLAGLGMSNAGVGVPSGYGAAAPSTETRDPQPAPPSSAPSPAPAPTLTAVSDLSKKPVPPQLDSALTRFYPIVLRNRGVEGEALIRVILAKDGRVSSTSAVSESHPGFASACEKALRSSRWEPPIDKLGNPTMTAIKYRCRFRVNL